MNKVAPFVFAGGGTGGHLFPAIAIAQQLKEKKNDARIVFIGAENKIEAKVLPKYEFEYYPISIHGLQRTLSLRNLGFPLTAMRAIRRSQKILDGIQPKCVIGTGGYVSGPVLYAARKKYKTLIHEQNIYPGLTTRLLEKHADVVCVSYEETKKYITNPNVTTSGNPIRKELKHCKRKEGIAHYGFDFDRNVIFVFGGSLGSHSINEAMIHSAALLRSNGVQIIWQTGSNDYNAVSARFLHTPGIQIHEFIYNMSMAYAAADLIICRAGASTLAEITILGKPSILIPYPHAAHDHQRKNAKSMEAHGCSIVLDDEDLKEKMAETVTFTLAQKDRLSQMKMRALEIGRPDAAEVIVNKILELINSKSGY